MNLDIELINELLEDTINLAYDENSTSTLKIFVEYIKEMLPISYLNCLEEINGDSSFLEDIYEERFSNKINDDNDNYIENGYCLMCERKLKLTKHHLYPKETHKIMIKKGIKKEILSSTILICRMCHSTIHRFFSNIELAKEYYSLDLLLSNQKVYKYCKWANSSNKQNKI